MNLFNLKKNDRITVNVLGSRQFSNKSIFEVEYNGQKCQVPMFEFQKSLELPKQMECVVVNVTENKLFLQQNVAALIGRTYSENQICEFTVDSDYTNTSNPFYKLTDGSGFYFKLRTRKDQKFTRNQKVKCRIKSVRGVEVDIEYIGTVHEMNDNFKFGTLLRKIGRDARILAAALRHQPWSPDVATLYEANSSEWLPKSIEAALKTFETTVPADITASRLELLESLARVIVWFLEDSDYFDSFAEKERYQWQTRFDSYLRHSMALVEAYRTIIDSHQHDFAYKIVRKFRASGYLILAGHKLLTLKCVLAIDPGVLNDLITELTDAVLARRNDCLRDPVFSNAFIKLLQLYIDNNHHTLDEMDEAETDDAKESLRIMLTALALQLLLANGHEENHPDIDFEINRSRLYRYVTLQNNSGDELMLGKALNALLACEASRSEYTWNDVAEILQLSSRLRQPVETATLPALYESSAALIKVSDHSIMVEENASDTPVLAFPPANTEMWCDMGIYLASPLDDAPREPRTIAQHKLLWRLINRRLAPDGLSTELDAAKKFNIRTTPRTGDVATIEIYEVDPANRQRFRCRIVDDSEYVGRGWIDKKDIVGSNQELSLDMFTAPDKTPYRFEATVTAVKSADDIQFSLVDTLNDYIDSITRYDDVEECAIISKIGDSCTVLSKRGFTINVELDADHDYLEKGDIIKVSNLSVEHNWREGDFMADGGLRGFDFAEATAKLLRDFANNEQRYADPSSATTDEGASLQEANRMTTDSVVELTRIIENVASRVRDNVTAYNYYAYARLLARIAGNAPLAAYFDKRCGLLEEFDDFSTNGHVDLQHLDTLMSGLSMENNSLSIDGEKLRILSVLDHPENNAYLWNMFGRNTNESLQELSRLVLAYNMLDGFKMRDQRLVIRQKIYSKLKVNIEKEPTVVAGGKEGLTTEFKTSIAYPANSMRLDVAAQTAVIMKVITAFLNTEGGTLYIGVSDEGYVRGLENDLAYFKSKDRFDRHVHDNLRHHLTFIPNSHLYIATEWIENSGKDIYVVKVNRPGRPIALDGQYYRRDGSSCVIVRPDQVESFLSTFDPVPQSATLRPSPSPAAAQPIVNAPAAAPTLRPSQPDTDERPIATSRFRNNVLHDGYPGYEPVSEYLYIQSDGHFDLVADDRWSEESSALTLGLHQAELDSNLVIVSSTGHIVRFPIRQLAASEGHFSSKASPIFISPITDDDKLIMIYRSTDGTPYKRLFSTKELHQGRTDDRGELPDREIGEVLFCEIVRPDAQQSFKSIVRKQRIGKDAASIEREQSAILERLRKE